MADPITMLAVGSTALNALGSIHQGESEKAAADFRAKQLRHRANQAAGQGQRAAIEEKRQASILAGRAQAVAAASGGGATDPTVINRIAGIVSEGEYRALTALYEGDSESDALKNSAIISKFEGKQAQRAGYIKAVGSILSGGSTMFGNYGQGGPRRPGGGGGASGGFADYSGGSYSYESYSGSRYA